MRSIIEKAYAKINLSLDVISKRADGYHDVAMLMQTINLYDSLKLTVIPRKSIKLKTNVSYIPTDSRNLVMKIAEYMFDTYKLPGGLFMELKKHIPVAAGMAGGSTDAAAALRGINKLYDLKLTLDQLAAIGKPFGADIPYCIYGGTYLAEGIGEILTPLTPCPPMHILIVKPKISVSTPTVYGSLDVSQVTEHPDTFNLIRAIEDQDSHYIATHLCNVLESVTIPLYPLIQTIKKELIHYGASGALMSGSGPTVFGIFEDKVQLEAAYDYFKNNTTYFVFQTQVINERMYSNG